MLYSHPSSFHGVRAECKNSMNVKALFVYLYLQICKYFFLTVVFNQKEVKVSQASTGYNYLPG